MSSLLISLNPKPYISKTSNYTDHIDYSKVDFNFKYVSKTELQTIWKQVKREKKKQKDEVNWNYYLKSKLEKNTGIVNSSNSLIPTNQITKCDECGLLTPAETLSVQTNVMDEIPSPPEFEISLVDASQSHNYQFGPGLMKRLQDLLDTVRKMTALLLNPSVDSQHEEEDVERTIKRSLEFDAMFARNYLYETQRLLKDIKQTMMGKNAVLSELESKISAILKSVTQALLVYTKHVNKGSRVKYQQVVPIFQCITTTLLVMETLFGQRNFPMRHDLEVSCSYFKQVMLDLSTAESRTVIAVSHKAPKFRLKHKPSSDLSMYSRRQREWRRKTATLARARFGPPGAEKKCKISASDTCIKDSDGIANRKPSSERGIEESKSIIKETAKQPNERVNSKELLFRKFTRAVPEEQVKTMVEKIPYEPLDNSEFFIDDDIFQALKLVTPGNQCVNQGPNVNGEEMKSMNVQEHTALEMQEENVERNMRSAQEISNVQLVCVTETPDTRNSASKKDIKDSKESVEMENKTLTIQESEQSELLEYKQKISEYTNSSPLYKNDKALGIIDRLASRILKDILTDFQNNEMDHVIQTLYNLEFE